MHSGTAWQQQQEHTCHGISPGGLPHSETTISEVLREDYGYSTHMSGKWHLGTAIDYLPTNHGFDSFYGMGVTINVRSKAENSHTKYPF